jgi:hypothetical protein
MQFRQASDEALLQEEPHSRCRYAILVVGPAAGEAYQSFRADDHSCRCRNRIVNAIELAKNFEEPPEPSRRGHTKIVTPNSGTRHSLP